LAREVPGPGPEDWREVLELSGGLVKQWEARGAVVLADFEGAFTGFEGEPLTAAFQRTFTLDPKSLRQLPVAGPSKDMGLFVDLRNQESAAIAKRIMESESIVKVVWGADNDVVSLRYTPIARPLGISSARVVDAQLGFSAPHRRLAMGAMLERLPASSLKGLPGKAAIDFRGAHAFNRRAIHLPLEPQEVAYAVDDLHRLDAILRSQIPRSGSYLQAQSQSSSVVSLILQSPASASADKLRAYSARLSKRTGLERQEIAVRAKRHIMAVRRAISEGAVDEFSMLEKEADLVLQQAGVSIPDDLSFSAAGPAETHAAEATGTPAEVATAAPEAEPSTAQAEEAGEEEAEAAPAKKARHEAATTVPETKAEEAVADDADEAGKEEVEASLAKAAMHEAAAQPVGESATQPEGEASAPQQAKKQKVKKRKAAAAAPAPEASVAQGPSESPTEPQKSQVKKKKKRRANGASLE